LTNLIYLLKCALARINNLQNLMKSFIYPTYRIKKSSSSKIAMNPLSAAALAKEDPSATGIYVEKADKMRLNLKFNKKHNV